MIFKSPVRAVFGLLLSLLLVQLLVGPFGDLVNVDIGAAQELADTRTHLDGIRLTRGFVMLTRDLLDPVLDLLLVVAYLDHSEYDELVTGVGQTV